MSNNNQPVHRHSEADTLFFLLYSDQKFPNVTTFCLVIYH